MTINNGLKTFFRLILVSPVSFWFTTVSVWLLPQLVNYLIESEISGVRIIYFISALGILLTDVLILLWAFDPIMNEK